MKGHKSRKTAEKKVVKHILSRLTHIFTSNDDLAGKIKQLCKLASADAMFEYLEGQKGVGVTAKKQSELQKAYQKFFTDLLGEYGVSSPADLSEEQKEEFFNSVKQYWDKGVGAKEDPKNIPKPSQENSAVRGKRLDAKKRKAKGLHKALAGAERRLKS